MHSSFEPCKQDNYSYSIKDRLGLILLCCQKVSEASQLLFFSIPFNLRTFHMTYPYALKEWWLSGKPQCVRNSSEGTQWNANPSFFHNLNLKIKTSIGQCFTIECSEPSIELGIHKDLLNEWTLRTYFLYHGEALILHTTNYLQHKTHSLGYWQL